MHTECFAVRKFVCLAALFTILSLTSGTLFGQETGGAIGGTLKDASGAVIAGGKVTITNAATGRIFTTTTGAEGNYVYRNLEPGRYSVRFDMSGFAPVEMTDVVLQLGKTLKVDGSLQVATVEQAVTVIESVPLVDLSSTTVGHNVTAEEFDRLPKARSFQSMLRASPSVNSGTIEGGFQVNGSSGAENQFVIDGVSTNSQIDGRSRQNTVMEYLQEVQVKTGSVGAEYGGALGGVMSAVTKSGGNQFHGDLHYYFSGNGISAAPVKRLVLNPATETDFLSNEGDGFVHDAKQPDKNHEVGGSLGGYFIKNKLWFFVAGSPRWSRREFLYNTADAQQITLEQKRVDRSVFAKVSYDPFTRMRTNFSWLWTPTNSTGRLPAYAVGANTSASKFSGLQPNADAGFFNPQSNYTGTVDFTLRNNMLLSVKAGRFWDDFKESGIIKQSAVEYRTPTTALCTPPETTCALLNTVPANLLGVPPFSNIPRLKTTDHDVDARTFINVDYSVFGNLAGDHDLKLGVGTQKNVNNVDNSYPGGGYIFVYWGGTVSAALCKATPPCKGTYGYYTAEENGTIGSTGANITHLYISDTWKIHPRLTLNLGLRTEKETVPGFRRDIAEFAFDFPFSDKIAPRLGFSYDVLGDGNMKVSFAWGRFYDWVKYELSRGTFGGDVWRIRYRSLDTTDVFSLSGTNTPGRDLFNPAVPNSFQDNRKPSYSRIDPDVKPMSEDQMNATIEYQMGPQMLFRGSYVHSGLRRTIEDMGVVTPSGIEYIFGNPGEGKGKFAQISTATKSFPTPRVKRNYDAMELSLQRRFSNNWFANVSYVLSRLYGNYSGLASTDEIRTPAFAGAFPITQQQGAGTARAGSSANLAFDLDEMMWDSLGNLDPKGLLPTDRTHVLKLYGSYQFKFGTEVGGFFNASSGTPLSTQVYSANDEEVLVNGRGDLGRTPMLSQTDLQVSHTWSITESKKLRFEFNMQNLFNQKTARHSYVFYNFWRRSSASIDLSGVDLAKGYDYKSMLATKCSVTVTSNCTADGPKALDPRFGKDDLFNEGFVGRLGIKFTF